MNAHEFCPVCNTQHEVGWLATDNEFEFHCEKYDVRFSKDLVIRPEDLKKIPLDRSSRF